MIEYLIIPLDYIILAIGSIVLIISFWRGFIASILGLLTWVGSIIITIYFYTNLSNFINSQLLKIKVFANYDQITIMLSTIISVPLIVFSSAVGKNSQFHVIISKFSSLPNLGKFQLS